MCFDASARPPIDGILEHVESKTFRVELAEGRSMAAFFAMSKHDGRAHDRRAETRLGARVILLPDNRDVTPFYERFAEHLASAGHPTLAIDYFARPLGYIQSQQVDMRTVMQRIADLTRDGCYEQLHAATKELIGLSGGAVTKVVAIG